MSMDARTTIKEGKAILGIEFGSTRIKAVLIDQENKPIAQGAHEWENQLENGLWTYSIDAIWKGLQDCYADLQADVRNIPMTCFCINTRHIIRIRITIRISVFHIHDDHKIIAILNRF